MKKYIAAILLGLSVFAGLVYSDVPLKSIEDVQGSWKLEYTKKSANTTDTIKREDTWTFQDGKVAITHIPREGTMDNVVGFSGQDLEEGTGCCVH